ncbi:MAG: UDP-N-acetylmuramoyl-L-alanyl-D-glutamate--2,6-diaminopimelate ligase [Anaerolineae bacterium]|nr:UDP-N-acetylmuramoyl-L-alanyl-D-glutamate--2,6-diaminopimelate ligase [Anaerolineae bacterium]
MTGFLKQTLKQLFQRIPVTPLSPAALPEVPVTGITLDSRQVNPGFIFVAIQGDSSDGHRYIPMAIERGAAAVIGTQALSGLNVPYVQVEDSRVTLAHLSAAFYNFPARHMTVIGVTGTDGKTTTANLIYNILLAAELRVGIISTVNAVIGDEVLDTGLHVTTPEAPDVQRYLSRMLSSGLTHVVLEATSHGLAQHRVTACDFDLGVVTNITHEHLDFHKTYEAYREAKASLFTTLSETYHKDVPSPRLAVLNADDLSFDYLNKVTRVNKMTYGTHNGADIWAEDVRHEPSGLYFTAVYGDKRFPVESRLVGLHNVSNILGALAATVLGLGISFEDACRGIANLQGIPGRMEQIYMGQAFLSIVDFAHTPNALKRALETARQLTDGKVVAVFGSAGLRDREKRKLMAEISVELADRTILTAEDPRTESLDDILAEMAEAAEKRGGKEGVNFWRVKDRGEAIRMALRMAEPCDVVISCGKGHEQSMCFGTVEHPWDDRTAMRAALAEYLHVTGPRMPYLPTQD